MMRRVVLTETASGLTYTAQTSVPAGARIVDVLVETTAAWAAAISGSPAPEQLEDSRRKIELAVKRIESTLAAGPWLHRGQYSIVDIGGYALAATLPRLAPDIVNPKSTPRMLDWLERIGSRPAVKEVMGMRRLKEPGDVYAPGPEHSRWG